MRKTILALTSLTLAFSACKKDDGGSGTVNGTATLTSGRWKITAISSVIEYPSPIGTQTIDGTLAFQPCTLDNLFIFNTDGTVTTDEGPTKCNASDPQQKTGGSWALTNNNTHLTSSDGTTTIDADVLTLDNTTLKVRYVTNYNNIRTTTTTTYINQ